ncbi:hypothetical protein OS493_027685 [Desmophyllum pertusum]|uniref:Uncharacterized protein n=1 Tax=Desmophyllum pertusum TaxID=174260 RepID=A0A9X0D3I4_9CNID|nr:hypothetical protein OS493_027685 [Desmophyllum pertusum]
MQECDNGRWTNDRPQCKASCRSSGGIARGKKTGSNYGHGKTVRYDCDAEYTLEGKNILTCDDGKWNYDSPKCRAPCRDPGPPINGTIQGDNFRHNSWVTFSCDRNYQRDGNERIKCNDGTWTVCTDPGKPTNGKRLDDNFQNGKTVTFKCNANYDLLGNHSIRCNGGVWSSDAPKCKGQCTFSGNPGNGYTTKRFFGRGEKLIHGSSVEYACDVSYTLTGSNILHCDDGSWSTSVPSCKASCDDPGLIGHGRKAGNAFSHGKIVTYECTTPGYSLEGNPQLTCNNGNWDSDRPKCKASCDPLPALSNGKIHKNHINHGSLVSFSCNQGFQHKGVRQIMCIDGKWNGSSPTCKGTCKNPGQLVNGQIRGDDYSYDATIDFQCNSGYDLNGSGSVTCVKGVWNSQIPACKKRCQDPGKPANGWLLGNNYSHGGTVQFRCKDWTFDLFGASRITCIEGEWSHPTPSCEARCGDPGRPDNGIKEGDDYRSRANVTFRCNPPLELIGSHVISCQEGKWSASRPTCSSCARPLGLQGITNQDIRITSPAYLNFNYRPSSARLNGHFAWCASKQANILTYLQIDLGKAYKLTAIATQGGTVLDKWVKRYRISFKTGPTNVFYSESGLTKDIDGNKDASSLVEYKFKEPFITSTVWIYPLFVGTDPICMRTELYGCDPTPDCVHVGSMFWGLWTNRDRSLDYYKAYITKLNDTHVDFVLEISKQLTRSYRRTEPVLIIDDNISEIKNVARNAPVIAQHKSYIPEWYRTGTVMRIWGTSFVTVKFDDGVTKWVRLPNLRLVKRPRFLC